MAEIKCPCGLRNHMEEEDCKKISCNACCPLTKPQTNADRIRAMSDEELAKMLTVGKGAFACFECLEIGDGECSMKCDERCLEWLRQPAETDIIQ